jgi:lysophospholipase L1-like esterase
MRRLGLTALISLTLLATGASLTSAQDKPASPHPSAKWEANIAKFEKQDETTPPQKHGIVFVGSSSIVRWDLKKSFLDLPAINRGFGGSQLADSLYFVDRIVTKYEPQIVVLYAGDNDLQAGKTPEQIAADFDGFVERVHAKLPKTKIIYVAVKPSVARWKLIDKVRATNKLIAAACAQDDQRLVFLDIQPLMYGDNGEPDPQLFAPDGLHLSDAGYARWNQLLLPLLKLKPEQDGEK